MTAAILQLSLTVTACKGNSAFFTDQNVVVSVKHYENVAGPLKHPAVKHNMMYSE